jgi:hypothetical protein
MPRVCDQYNLALPIVIYIKYSVNRVQKQPAQQNRISKNATHLSGIPSKSKLTRSTHLVTRVKTRFKTLRLTPQLWHAKNSNCEALQKLEARHDARREALHDASIVACLTRDAPLDAAIVAAA